MSKAKYTPGPWMARQMVSGNWDICAEDGDGSTMSRTTSEANAHLIAAAPDLLEAAQVLLTIAEQYDRDLAAIGKARNLNSAPGAMGGDPLSFARAAIAKATGEQNAD